MLCRCNENTSYNSAKQKWPREAHSVTYVLGLFTLSIFRPRIDA